MADRPKYATMLSGLELDGWLVGDLLRVGRDRTLGTGGHFSVAYRMSKGSNETAFLKALDFSSVLATDNSIERVNELTSDYLFEVQVLRKCHGKRFDRIVLAISSGQVFVDENDPLSVVPYIIFEMADGDVRQFLTLASEVELDWKLRILHNVAVGLKQLHSIDISHQDLKPSNVLVYPTQNVSKIADLGRAVDKNSQSNHDHLLVAGAKPYAPPEAVYGYSPAEWNARRLGCDLYHLGSLICFFFTGLTMNVFLKRHVRPEHSPQMWNGTYADVLPYLRAPFDLAIDEFSTHVTNPVLRDELVSMVRQLCDPDVSLRGDSSRFGRGGNSYSLEKFINRLNVLEYRARLGTYN